MILKNIIVEYLNLNETNLLINYKLVLALA